MHRLSESSDSSSSSFTRIDEDDLEVEPGHSPNVEDVDSADSLDNEIQQRGIKAATSMKEEESSSSWRPNLAGLKLIKEAELQKFDMLGSGRFATVFKGIWTPEENLKIPVAIKVLREARSAEENSQLLEDAYIMGSVNHQHVLRLSALFMKSQLMLVTELMPLGCLLDYVQNNKRAIGPHAILTWSKQIALGMAYLEEHNVVHGNLAARNVLMKTHMEVKITDFYLAKNFNNDENEEPVSNESSKWMSLESIRDNIFTHKSDVWSFGVTVWELITFGGKPYEGIEVRRVPEHLEKGERLPQPSYCSIDLFMVLVKCWQLQSEGRPNFIDLSKTFTKFCQDPGRYLVIQDDKLMGLPSYTTKEERDLINSVSEIGQAETEESLGRTQPEVEEAPESDPITNSIEAIQESIIGNEESPAWEAEWEEEAAGDLQWDRGCLEASVRMRLDEGHSASDGSESSVDRGEDEDGNGVWFRTTDQLRDKIADMEQAHERELREAREAVEVEKKAREEEKKGFKKAWRSREKEIKETYEFAAGTLFLLALCAAVAGLGIRLAATGLNGGLSNTTNANTTKEILALQTKLNQTILELDDHRKLALGSELSLLAAIEAMAEANAAALQKLKARNEALEEEIAVSEDAMSKLAEQNAQLTEDRDYQLKQVLALEDSKFRLARKNAQLAEDRDFQVELAFTLDEATCKLTKENGELKEEKDKLVKELRELKDGLDVKKLELEASLREANWKLTKENDELKEEKNKLTEQAGEMEWDEVTSGDASYQNTLSKVAELKANCTRLTRERAGLRKKNKELRRDWAAAVAGALLLCAAVLIKSARDSGTDMSA